MDGANHGTTLGKERCRHVCLIRLVVAAATQYRFLKGMCNVYPYHTSIDVECSYDPGSGSLSKSLVALADVAFIATTEERGKQ